MADTLQNLMAAFNGESNASAKYAVYSEKAKADGYLAVAALFAAALRADITRHTEKVDGWTWEYEIAEGKAHYVVGSFTAKDASPRADLVIPSKLGGKAVASLGVNALQGYEFTTVTIPSTVITIGYHAFGYCPNLKSVKLPDSVKNIAYHAFEGCTALQCVDFGKNVSFIGVKAFEGCSSLRSLVFRGAKEPDVQVDQHTGFPDSFGGVASGCAVYVPKTAKDWPSDTWQGMPLYRGECMVNVNVSGSGIYGTASGSGVYPVGKKITLKATPKTGCVCGGWYDEETGVYYGHSASLSYVVTGADNNFRTGFAPSNATDDYLYVNALKKQFEADADGTVYVPVDVSSLSEPKVTVKGLPSGVKFDAAKMVLTGRATKPGTYPISVSATNKSTKNPKTAEFDLNVPNFKDDSIPLADMYGWWLPGAFYVETIDKAAGCKVTGLPSGMKWTDKDIYKKGSKTEVEVPANSVYGAPTKPGYYTVFFTKTDGNKVKHTATATFFVLPFKKLEVEMVGNSGKDKVTGAGECAVGKKITLKATADKGKVFSGWYFDSGCTSLVSLSPSFPFEMPLIGDVKFYAKFITAKEDAEGVYAVLDSAFLFEAKNPKCATEVQAGVYLEWPLEVTAKSQTTVAVSGLPSGLKFTAKDIVDSKTKTVTIPANTIHGTPTAASKTDKNTGNPIPSNVKIKVTTAGKTKVEYTLALTVTPLADWAVGTFDGGINDGGLGTLSVTAAGKISGKYIGIDGRTWTLSANNFDDLDYELNESGVLLATLAAKSGNDTATFSLGIVDNGTGGVALLEDLEGPQIPLYKTNWKGEPWKGIAAKIAKAAPYNDSVTDEAGNKGTLTLKFAAAGKVTAKGKFGANSVSCSTVVVPLSNPNPHEAFSARIYICFPRKGSFAGYCNSINLIWNGAEFEFE